MTDIHTHLLYDIDDGAENIETSIAMLEIMKCIGITSVVCTPHFDYTNISPDEFFAIRKERMSKLAPIANDYGITILSGCELRLTPRVLNLESVDNFCIENTRYVLVELPFSNEWEKTCIDMLTNFIDYFNVTPIIAHVERYPAVIKNIRAAEKLVELGAILQLDASSLFEKLYIKTAKKLIKKELISVVSSDCHNTHSRSPEILADAYSEISGLFKNGAVEYIKNFSDNICKIKN